MTDKYGWRTGERDGKTRFYLPHTRQWWFRNEWRHRWHSIHMYTPRAISRFRFRRSAIARIFTKARAFDRDIDSAFGRLSIVIVDRPISTGQGKGALESTSIADSERDRKTSISQPRANNIKYHERRVCWSQP